jgi:hypothetical protein
MQQHWHGALIDQNLDLVGLSACDVGQAPSSLKLKLGQVVSAQKRDELGNEIRVDDRLDWRIYLLGEESPEANSGEDDSQVVGVVDQHQQLLEVLQL